MTPITSGIAVLADAGTAIRARKGSPLMVVHIQNRDGIYWDDAPLPRKWHKCKAQTIALLGTGLVRRCACGAISWNGGMWIERNSRRNGPKDDHSTQSIPYPIPKHSGGNRRMDSQ